MPFSLFTFPSRAEVFIDKTQYTVLIYLQEQRGLEGTTQEVFYAYVRSRYKGAIRWVLVGCHDRGWVDGWWVLLLACCLLPAFWVAVVCCLLVGWAVALCFVVMMDLPFSASHDPLHPPNTLSPPFNAAARERAGMGPEWYEPLITPPVAAEKSWAGIALEREKGK